MLLIGSNLILCKFYQTLSGTHGEPTPFVNIISAPVALWCTLTEAVSYYMRNVTYEAGVYGM